jgi:ABC-type sugar transport system permease subunit
MMTAVTSKPNHSQPSPLTDPGLWLRLLTGWHLLLVLGGIGGILTLWTGGSEAVATWLRPILTGLLLLLALGSGTAVYYINRLTHKGRVLSLAINYLGLIVSLVVSLHLLNLFVGIDSLANNFARGLPFLGLAFLGYLVASYADRYEYNPRMQHQLRQAGKWIAIVAAVAFLLAIRILAGLQATLGRLDNVAVITAVLAIPLFAIFIWAMWRSPMADTFGATNAHGEMLSGWLFLSPNLLGFLIFFAGPLLLSLYVSFTNWDAFGTQDWVGLDNYAGLLNLTIVPLAHAGQLANQAIDVTTYSELTRFTIFGRSYIIGAEDRLFWIALGNTIQFAFFAVPLSVIPALFLANLLNSKIPGMTFFRAIYFLPSVAAVVGIALVWQWLFNSTVGYINYFITLLIDFLNSSGPEQITDPQIRWLSSSNTALLAVVIMSAWQWTGFNTVLFLAGLQNIPKELYEAATVDGANSWQKFYKVTLPLLAPTTFFVLTTTIIQSMQVFEQVFILIPTNPAGPNNSTLTIVLYLYQKGFQRFEQGYASAIAWVLFLLIFAVTLYQFQRQRRGGSTYDL